MVELYRGPNIGGLLQKQTLSRGCHKPTVSIFVYFGVVHDPDSRPLRASWPLGLERIFPRVAPPRRSMVGWWAVDFLAYSLHVGFTRKSPPLSSLLFFAFLLLFLRVQLLHPSVLGRPLEAGEPRESQSSAKHCYRIDQTLRAGGATGLSARIRK